jgi:lipopolysaccharide export system protein LptA
VTALSLVAIALLAPPAAPVPVQVDADEVHYQYRDRKVLFIGKPLVRLTREDAVLTCRRLVADNDEQGKLEKAVCTGDVRLVRGVRTVTCEKATFEEKLSRVVCVGNPELHDGKSVMRGDLLVYDLDEDRATLSTAKGTMVPKPGEDPIQRRKKEAPK